MILHVNSVFKYPLLLLLLLLHLLGKIAKAILIASEKCFIPNENGPNKNKNGWNLEARLINTVMIISFKTKREWTKNYIGINYAKVKLRIKQTDIDHRRK